MEKQASGLISLDSLDAKSGARAICRYSVGAKCDARITAQLPDEAKYIAIIWACERPIVLGEMKKTNTGWEVQGEFESECVDACFIAMKTPSDLNAILCGKAMGAKVDMDKALFKLRLLADNNKAQAPQRYSAAETPFSAKAKAAEESAISGEKAPSAAPPPLERFVASVKERAIAPKPPAIKAKQAAPAAKAKQAAPAAKAAPAAPAREASRRPQELLRRETPDYSRCIGNPFPGLFPGCKWDLVTYPGAQHPHYLAGHWRRGSKELLVSCVPGEKAPQPPRWLDGFTEHHTSRWGQGYWIGLSDYRTGKPAF